ncbi:hypothetical protein AWB91_26165 [Mycobacterium paraense]|uniref:Transmembrane protein n=1 Tax=Mycobacterium paraense TaxID=767916 RepID=A0ABX3VHB8_9MYCO|nr:hypothetical protein [Mycobacterium paraense]ORW28711.1 hypothetical protein AWB91_26165 [Mycobacterium paraense]ORW38142.1 hypothetical protein AWB88_20995 [Mycobacterium paraense]
MLIIALVLALIGLVALVFAVVTSNELVAWVCIGASVIGVVLLIVDALRERQRRDAVGEVHDVDEAADAEEAPVDYPEEAADEEEHPAAEGGVDEASQGLETSDESAVPAEGRGEDRAT